MTQALIHDLINMITITFQCGHTRQTDGNDALRCGLCGETQIAAVVAPAPRFAGHCRGPHAEYADLPAKAVSFTAEKTNG